jgi:hypothetical protein
MKWEVNNMKFAVSIFTTLVIIIGAVLFVQYQVYSDRAQTEVNEFNYTQEIEVVLRDNSLDIRHHFKNLPNQQVDVNLPSSALEVECFLETSSSCERLSEDHKSFQPGEARSQAISYVLPLKQPLTANFVLKNVFASLPLGEASYSTVHITTDSQIVGQWVTGLPLIGQQQLKLVNYTMFSGEGQVKDLYWTPNNTTVQKISEHLTIYSNEPVLAQFKEELGKMEMLSEEHMAIVQSDVMEPSYRMLFLPSLSVDTVQASLTLSQIETMYNFEESTPLWVKEMMVSFLTGTIIGSEKTEQIVLEITERMTDRQLESWKDQLEKLKDNLVTMQVLDDTLSSVLNSSTNFLVKNSEVKYVYPFYNIDTREVLLNSKEIKEMGIIYYEGRVLYKAKPLLEALGYNAYEGENGYYVNSETRVFRFPKEHGFYVYNQRRYNTSAQPIVKLQDDYYVEETWMQRLFLVDLAKKDSAIYIQTIEGQTE